MATLTFPQIKQLWIDNGGAPALAPVMAAISLAESGGRTDVVNNNPSTGDYSVGLFQINYIGSMMGPRTARYGSPAQLVADPNLQAKAAISLAGNGSGLSNWTTYTKGTYKRFLSQDTGNILTPGGATLSPAPPQTPGASGGQVNEAGGDEGEIAMPSIIPNIPRSGIRKVVGGAVLVSGAVVGLVGLGLLVGGGKVPTVREAIRQRSLTGRERLRQEGYSGREETRQQASLQRQQERAVQRRRATSEKASERSSSSQDDLDRFAAEGF